MTKNQKNTVWERNNIPALEYCSLFRAAELLNCQVQDILHYAEVGAIELCIKLDGFEAKLDEPSEISIPDIWENAFQRPYFKKYVQNSRLSYFSPALDFGGKSGDTITVNTCNKATFRYEYNDTPGLKKPIIHLYGLWAITPTIKSTASFFSELQTTSGVSLLPYDFQLKEAEVSHSETQKKEVIHTSPRTEHIYPEGLLDIQKLTPIVILKAKDIYITRQQIEKIHSGIGSQLPNHINGGIERPEKEKINDVNQNKVGEFIEMLIKCVPELGDEVLEVSANKRHSILIAFLERKQKEGYFTSMKIPASATIEKYFKI